MSIHFDLSEYRGSVFVDTCVDDGDAIIAAIQARFFVIYGIQTSKALQEQASERIRQEAEGKSLVSVTLLGGDPADFLAEICQRHRYLYGPVWGQKTTFYTFWMDAKPMNPDRSGDAGSMHLVNQLKIIRKEFSDLLLPPIFLINNLSLILAEEEIGGEKMINKVLQQVSGIDERYQYKLLPSGNGGQDVLVALPQWYTSIGF